MIRPCNSVEPNLTVTAIVLSTLTKELPTVPVPQGVVQKITDAGIHLADEQFWKPSSIDILLGADVFAKIMDTRRIELGPEMPVAFGTIFGFVVMGQVTNTDAPQDSSGEECLATHTSTDLNNMVEKFWQSEELSAVVLTDPDDQKCELMFEGTTSRDPTGRYTVRLPFRDDHAALGDSWSAAFYRFISTERRLIRNPNFRTKYTEFMREYQDLGHMTECSPTEIFECGRHYYIPHHGIFKTSGDANKIRVVFDGSCPTTTGVSLNDCLYTGKKLQKDIVDVILRFRRHQAVFVTDIRMMFRQIKISPTDRNYQLILWREAPDQPLKTFRLNTVTYGLRSSPYHANRCILQLAKDERQEFPIASKILETDVYVDDILTGAESISEARNLQRQLIDLLARGGFELRKWSSNFPELLQDFPRDHCEDPHQFDLESNIGYIKVLGIQWDPRNDHFTYKVNIPADGPCTKRTILSTIARTYDPSGWISPVIFRAKVVMQRLWTLKSSWDAQPPRDIVAEWQLYMSELHKLEEVKLKRCITTHGTQTYTLHGFSDASELGYAAAVYLRTENHNGRAEIQLLLAKSKVAPLKTKLTIPQMELNGAVLLTLLVTRVISCLEKYIDVREVVGWCDSTIVLTWLQVSPHLLQVFEGNRVSKIVNCETQITWKHVPSRLNAADCASRGCTATELVDHPLWWGPEWLLEPPSTWPPRATVDADGPLPGLKKAKIKTFITVPCLDIDLLERYSSLDKLIGVTAYILRFANNLRQRENRRYDLLTVKERREALLIWIRIIQSTEFTDDIENIAKGKNCSTQLARLCPFIDAHGLLRVGGRLRHSELEFEAKHPILLPKNGRLVELIIDHHHKVHCHAGPIALQAILQQRFWIMSARRAIRARIFKCIPCFRLKARITQPIMADLPVDRVTQTRVFDGVGTDFAGPFQIKASRLRNAKMLKAYLCVFVCLATKAVHFEVVSELSTEAFLAALSRFVSRRGLPSLIRSDCGTNYVGSNRHLNDVHKYLRTHNAEIGDHLSRRGVKWLFNPPAAPNFGGLFESVVKSAKTHLKRTIGEQSLTFEELTTVFVRIEAVLNSRPLGPLSSDPAEYEFLSPSHFIIGQPLVAVPEYSYKDTQLSRLARFQLVQAISQNFWRRWHNDYLHTLQQRLKWTSHTNPPKIGDLVVLKEDGLPPLKWTRARIASLLPGKDGTVRVIKLITPHGTLVRPVNKVCRLPVDPNA